MVFSSITFLVYFLPVLLLVYFLVPHRFRNKLLLLASILFYSWGAPKFIFVILITTCLDFFLVKRMDESTNLQVRRGLLGLSISINLGLLFYFKYCNFFIENVNKVLYKLHYESVDLLNVVLPIGISFYTFESLTYVIDVYRKEHKPLQNFWQYQLYIILFPKLIAGPIVRYKEIADQITNRKAEDNINNKHNGFFRFTLGLAKKVFIANTLAVYADEIFNLPTTEIGTIQAWIGMFCYTFQIYFDFSGYSDMAIGLAQMFGFRFPENFNSPYCSQSITEFWRRWHITLGKWMKNYLYIPLGGNRFSTNRTYLNLWIVFLASGLWHGASWTFIVWGAYHGTFLILEKMFLLSIYKRLGKGFRIALTFLIVSFGWVIFRADYLSHAAKFLLKLFSFDLHVYYSGLSFHLIFFLILSAVFSFLAAFRGGHNLQESVYSFNKSSLTSHLPIALLSCFLLTLAIANLASAEFNPFIYFRF